MADSVSYDDPLVVRSPSMEQAASVRSGRRLCDKILAAFHCACDQGDFAAADELLAVAGRVLSRGNIGMSVERRRVREALVAAHERLWHLRHRFEDAD